MYFIKGAAAGGICCSITHGALCPVDVVKTRVQLDPVKVRRRRMAPFSLENRYADYATMTFTDVNFVSNRNRGIYDKILGCSKSKR